MSALFGWTAMGRLERLEDGRARLGMKRVWRDATRAIELSPLEPCEKLAAIVPRARANQGLFTRVLAGNATWRKEVVPKVPTASEAEREARASLREADEAADGGGRLAREYDDRARAAPVDGPARGGLRGRGVPSRRAVRAAHPLPSEWGLTGGVRLATPV